MTYAIEVKGLSKSFGGRRVVDDFAIQLGKGASGGFLGPNGSGKTTTLRMLCGLLTPDAGEGTCLGPPRYPRKAGGRRDQAAHRLHDPAVSLYEDLTDRGEPAFVARHPRAPTAGASGWMRRLGRAGPGSGVGEGNCAGDPVRRLEAAPGARRRDACIEPRLLLLDEPTAGVDPRARRNLLGRDPCALRRAALTVLVVHPLHGRSRALPRDRLHRLRAPARPRDGGRGAESRAFSPSSGTAMVSTTGRGRSARGRAWKWRRRSSGPRCTQASITALEAAIALYRRALHLDRGAADAGGRFHPPEGDTEAA